MFPDLHTDFSRGRSDGLVFPSLSEFSMVYYDLHKGFGIVNKAEIDVFLELSCFFDDPTNVGNSVSGSSAFSKSSLNIWKFTVHVLLKTGQPPAHVSAGEESGGEPTSVTHFLGTHGVSLWAHCHFDLHFSNN